MRMALKSYHLTLERDILRPNVQIVSQREKRKVLHVFFHWVSAIASTAMAIVGSADKCLSM
jgi:hypothetical protein